MRQVSAKEFKMGKWYYFEGRGYEGQRYIYRTIRLVYDSYHRSGEDPCVLCWSAPQSSEEEGQQISYTMTNGLPHFIAAYKMPELEAIIYEAMYQAWRKR